MRKAGIKSLADNKLHWRGSMSAKRDRSIMAMLRPAMKKARLGDKIERVTRSVGIKPCGGCNKRKRFLNGELTQPPDT